MTTSGDATRPTIPDLMRRLAGTHGALPQIQDQAGPLTFTEGQQRSAAMARGLLASGVGKGEKVGILMPNGADWVTAWLAITRIGAVAVLLSTFAKPRELAGLLRQADVRTLLACDSFLKADFVSRLEAALPGLADQDGARGLRLPSAPYLRAIWTSSTPAPSWAAGDYASLPAVPGRTPSTTRCSMQWSARSLRPIRRCSSSRPGPRRSLRRWSTRMAR